MPNILISYRRDDSDAIAGRIRDRVASQYGDDCVFMDIDSIPFGLDFREQVQNALMKNDVVLAIIGPKWTGSTRGGSVRIQDETDPVRIEIETALKRGIPVIPVLVGKAAMPKAIDLPASLKDLPFLNAAEVSHGRDFNQHIERLLRSIDRFLKTKATEPTSSSKNAQEDMAPTATSVVAEHRPQPHEDGDNVALKHERKYSGLRLLMEQNGLLFANETLERAFIESFRDRFYFIGQTSMMFGIIAWVVFGATDLLSGTAGLRSIQFRFMFALPLLFLFFGLSFTQLARRLWQPFFAAFAGVGITCMYIALLLVGPESWFRAEQATMSFMMFIALVGLAPFTTIYTLGVGFFILVVHAIYTSFHPQLDGVHALFYALFVGASYVIICTTAWMREKSLRAAFVAKEQSSAGDDA